MRRPVALALAATLAGSLLVGCSAASATSCSDLPGPVSKGDPGYSSKLDRDGDGVACE